jgi:hypothetical protein
MELAISLALLPSDSLMWFCTSFVARAMAERNGYDPWLLVFREARLHALVFDLPAKGGRANVHRPNASICACWPAGEAAIVGFRGYGAGGVRDGMQRPPE